MPTAHALPGPDDTDARDPLASTAGGRGVATTGKDQHTPGVHRHWHHVCHERHQVTGTNALHRGFSTIAQEPEASSCGACDAGLAAGGSYVMAMRLRLGRAG